MSDAGIWIPMELLKVKNLTLQEKILISDIMGFPEYWKANTSIADILSVSKVRARGIVYKLIEKGILESNVIRDDSNNVLKRTLKINRVALNAICSKMSTPLCSDMSTPMLKNEHPLCSDMSTPMLKNEHPLCSDMSSKRINTENKKENKEEEATGVDDFHQVAKSYSDNIHPLGSQIEMEHLKALTDDFGKDTVIKAIEIAVMRNNKSLGYIKGILNRWETHGFDDGKPKPKQAGFSEAALEFMRKRDERKKNKC